MTLQKFLLVFFIISLNFKAHAFVIYGEDSRVDTVDHPDWRYRSVAGSVAAMIGSDVLGVSGFNSGRVINFTSQNLGSSENLCENEKFKFQPIAGNCSGFLIGPRTLVTAGHCVSDQDTCDFFKWVFDFKAKSRFDTLVSVDRSKVYNCKRIIKSVQDKSDGWMGPIESDYAVIELDRPVLDRRPLKLRSQFSHSIMVNEPVFLIGHPSGLPQKIADQAWVIRNNGGKGKFFDTNLDSFGGNSGSPVINSRTFEVEGILIGGENDYDFDEVKQCFRVKECRLNPLNCIGESVTRIKEVYNAFKN